MVLCTALILLVSSSYCNEQPTIPGQVPTRAECGEVNFAEAVEFGRKFLRESFQASRAPFKETWLDLDKPAYEVLSQKQLMIRFSGARLIFWRETGKFAGGGLSVLAPGTGDIGVADASGLAEKYFRLIEPHSDCKVELQGRSGENYQFKVVKVLSKIPFSEGFTCWIDPHYGRLASSLYVPSPPVHPSSIVRARIGEATNAASAAIARFAQSEWIFVHSDKTALEYWYPPADAIVQEMTDEQKAIARQRFAIPIYTIYATNVIVKGGREGHSLRYFISVDARN